MLPAPRIIAIDDNPVHLRGLAEALNRYGVACLQVHFSGDDSEIKKCPHVRVVFADLHLNESGAATDHARHFAIIGGLLEQTIAPAGPYGLVLWTRFADQADGLRAFLEERLQGVPKPFCVVPLDKNAHLDAAGNVRDVNALVTAIGEVVTSHPQFAALLNWEERILGAAAETVSAIIALAVQSAEPAARGEAIGRLLFRLAVEAVGEGNVGSNRFGAVNEALLPILADRVAALKSDNAEDLWTNALIGQNSASGISLEDASRLNKFLHFGSAAGVSWSERGAVIGLPDALAGAGFEATFGVAELTAAREQFGCPDFLRSDARFLWRLVQVQAACDFAQRQPGALPFLLGLEMPAALAKHKGIPEAVIRCPPMEIDGAPRSLHINARFPVCLCPTSATPATVAYRLREGLLNTIGYRLHSYGARPGIVSFRYQPARAIRPASTV